MPLRSRAAGGRPGCKETTLGPTDYRYLTLRREPAAEAPAPCGSSGRPLQSVPGRRTTTAASGRQLGWCKPAPAPEVNRTHPFGPRQRLSLAFTVCQGLGATAGRKMSQEDDKDREIAELKAKVASLSAPSRDSSRPSQNRWLPLAIVALLALAVGLFAIGRLGRSTTATEPATATSDQTPAIPPAPADLVSTGRPADEAAFLVAVQSAREAFQSAPNDLARGAAKAQRRAGVCAALRSGMDVRNWTGTVRELGANGDGKGILTIEIGDDVELRTWNNFFSDAADETLIDPNSTVFAAASHLSKGDPVRFSGNLFPDDVDCVKESSLGLAGSVEHPSYIMRFSAVAPLTAANATPPQAPAAPTRQATSAPRADETEAPARPSEDLGAQPTAPALSQTDEYVCEHGDANSQLTVAACDRRDRAEGYQRATE